MNDESLPKECINCQWHEEDGYCVHKYSEYSCEKVGDHWTCRWWQKPWEWHEDNVT